MLRTFSKIYGMGGLRLGWSYAPDSVLDILNRVRSPFNVSYPAIVSGIAALGDDEFIGMSQEHNQKWLRWTSDEIKGLGLASADSVCNFLVADFPNNSDFNLTAENADIFLRSKGIIVRRMGGYGLPNSLRITIGLEKEMKYLIESLKIFMSK
jgi:histidinol-phosphate aminotransferase